MSQKGLGDTIEAITIATGIKKVVDVVAKATGKDCGCAARRLSLISLFLISKHKKTQLKKLYNK